MTIINIEKKIEPFLVDEIENIEEVDFLENYPSCLTYNRFDLAFKLLFIDGLVRGKHLYFEKDFYKQHIKAISLGSFSEPGNHKKNNIIDYENTFSILYSDIKNKGFNKEKSLIPLAIDGSILNGAHRTAIAIYLKKNVSAIKTRIPAYMYDSLFFKNRGVPDKILDAVTLKYIEHSTNCFLAIIWPAATGNENGIEKLIDKIVYKKEIKLNYLGAHNLLSETYQDEPWLGSAEGNYSGIKYKLADCFPNFDKLKIYIFQKDTLAETVALKEEIRKLFNIGKHAVHITDSHEETLRISRLLLNDNGLHFLNNALPNKYRNTINKIDRFKEELNKNKASDGDYVLTSSMLMAVYGLKDTSNIAYLSKSKKIATGSIAYHERELPYHDVEEEDLLKNPDYHFWFRGVKFISLPQLYAMKCKRNKEKDRVDSLLIKGLIESNKFKTYLKSFKYKIIFFRTKIHMTVISFIKECTKKLNIYHFAEKTYRKFKPK